MSRYTRFDLFLVYPESVDNMKILKIILHLFDGFDYHELLMLFVRVMLHLDTYDGVLQIVLNIWLGFTRAIQMVKLLGDLGNGCWMHFLSVIFEVFHLFAIIDYFLDHGPYFYLVIVDFVLFLELKYKFVSELSL